MMASPEFTIVPVPSPRAGVLRNGGLFWKAGRSRLVLLFETLTDKIIVRAIDPDRIGGSVMVFRAELLPGQKDWFIQAVRDGREPTLTRPPPSNENRGLAAPVSIQHTAVVASQLLTGDTSNDAIVIADTSGDDHGPNLYLARRDTGTQG
jgi:hypothetical protein